MFRIIASGDGWHFIQMLKRLGNVVYIVFLLFVLTIVLYVLLRIMDSDYPFVIFKLFLLYFIDEKIPQCTSLYQARKVRGHVFVLGVYILSLSTIYLLNFGTVPTVWYILILSALLDYCYQKQNNTCIFCILPEHLSSSPVLVRFALLDP
jgi:hypothetical protein